MVIMAPSSQAVLKARRRAVAREGLAILSGECRGAATLTYDAAPKSDHRRFLETERATQ